MRAINSVLPIMHILIHHCFCFLNVSYMFFVYNFFVSLYVVLHMFQLVLVWNNFRQFLLNVKHKNLHPMIIFYVYSIICWLNYVSIKMKGCSTVLFLLFFCLLLLCFLLSIKTKISLCENDTIQLSNWKRWHKFLSVLN